MCFIISFCEMKTQFKRESAKCAHGLARVKMIVIKSKIPRNLKMRLHATIRMRIRSSDCQLSITIFVFHQKVNIPLAQRFYQLKTVSCILATVKLPFKCQFLACPRG